MMEGFLKLNPDQIEQVKSWLVEAGQIAMDGYASVETSWKPNQTPVTDVDYRVEALLTERIRNRFPGQQIISEESGTLGPGSDQTWVLDPIDGTKSYLRGLPTWGISLGLLEGGEPQAGFVYLPATQDIVWAAGNGAFWNGRRLSTNEDMAFDNPLAFLAVPSNAHRYYRISYPRLQAFGSTVLHLACVARGVAAGALTRRVYIWDIAGMLPILREAGMVYRYLSGAPIDLTFLFSGQKTPEPILVSRPQWMGRLRESIAKA